MKKKKVLRLHLTKDLTCSPSLKILLGLLSVSQLKRLVEQMLIGQRDLKL